MSGLHNIVRDKTAHDTIQIDEDRAGEDINELRNATDKHDAISEDPAVSLWPKFS